MVKQVFYIFIPVWALSMFAYGEDLHPPSWRGEADTAWQAWESWSGDLIETATDWNSPFGASEVVIYDAGPGYSNVTYDISPYNFPEGCWQWDVSDMSLSYPLLRIDNWPDQLDYSQIQVTWSVDFSGASPPYGMGGLLYINNEEEFVDGIYPASEVIGFQSLGINEGVETYHTTFYTQNGSYLVTNAAPFIGPEPLTNQATIYIHEIVVDTIYIPEPGTVMLLGLGRLALRKKKK